MGVLAPKPLLVIQNLSTSGDGTGTIHAIGDYRTGELGATTFYIQPPANEIFYLARLIVYIEDVGTIKGSLYGAMAALTNGIAISVTDADDVVILGSQVGITIKSNHEWARICYDVAEHDYGPTESNYVIVRWTFLKSGEFLELRDQQKFKVILNDDFSGLIDHTFNIQGFNASRNQDGKLRKGQGSFGN